MRTSQEIIPAIWLGMLHDKLYISDLKRLTTQDVPTVRIASMLALCRLGLSETVLSALADEIDDPNFIAGMYAADAVQQTGIVNDVVCRAAERASRSRYEFIRRYGKRWQSTCLD